MKIIIFSPTSSLINWQCFNEQANGGADQALVRLIKLLSKNHEVTAYIPIARPFVDQPNRITLIPFMDLFEQTENCDLFLLNRKCWAIPSNIAYKKLAFYTQDDIDSPAFMEASMPQDYFQNFDKLIVLSKYHKDRIQEYYTVPDNKIEIIGNGADAQNMEVKQPLEFIYSSTPFRGLVVLARMWKKIVDKYPTAKLHVYSSMQIYGKYAITQDKLHFQTLYDKLENMQGVVYHGARPQSEVLETMKKCWLLLYPNTFPETFCNVAMEARACWTPIITSLRGALPETCGEAALYINGNPYTDAYQEEFLRALDNLIQNTEQYRRLQGMCYPIRTWEHFEQDWTGLIEKLEEDSEWD